MIDIIIGLVLISFTGIALTCVIAKDIKAQRNSAPDGKTFVKEFSIIVDNVHRAMLEEHVEYLRAPMNLKTFKVRVERVHQYNGIMYSTLPMYRCYEIFIDDELVCIEHIVCHHCVDKVYLEFSNQRDMNEVIDIIKKSHQSAKEILRKNSPFQSISRKSFYTTNQEN